MVRWIEIDNNKNKNKLYIIIQSTESNENESNAFCSYVISALFLDQKLILGLKLHRFRFDYTFFMGVYLYTLNIYRMLWA